MDRPDVDFQILALRAKYAVPDGWEVSGWQIKNHGTPAEYVEFYGAVVTARFLCGPRKGQKNWSKKNRSSEMTLPLLHSDIQKAADRWSSETGLCQHCLGTGQRWRGWSAVSGNLYEHCKSCDGGGKRPIPPAL